MHTLIWWLIARCPPLLCTVSHPHVPIPPKTGALVEVARVNILQIVSKYWLVDLFQERSVIKEAEDVRHNVEKRTENNYPPVRERGRPISEGGSSRGFPQEVDRRPRQSQQYRRQATSTDAFDVVKMFDMRKANTRDETIESKPHKHESKAQVCLANGFLNFISISFILLWCKAWLFWGTTPWKISFPRDHVLCVPLNHDYFNFRICMPTHYTHVATTSSNHLDRFTTASQVGFF